MKKGVRKNNLVIVLTLLILATFILYFSDYNSISKQSDKESSINLASSNIFSDFFNQIFRSPEILDAENPPDSGNTPDSTASPDANTFDSSLKQPPQSEALINIGSCGSLTSGNTYTLQNDISSSGTCFSISGLNNVIIDGNGHSITSTGGTAITISGHSTNIVIKNAVISGNDYSIFFSGLGSGTCSSTSSDGVLIYNNTINSGDVSIGTGASAASVCNLALVNNNMPNSNAYLYNYQAYTSLTNITAINNIIGDGLTIYTADTGLIKDNFVYKLTSDGHTFAISNLKEYYISNNTFIMNVSQIDNAPSNNAFEFWYIQYTTLKDNKFFDFNTAVNPRKITLNMYGPNFINLTNNLFYTDHLNPWSSFQGVIKLRSGTSNTIFFNNTIIGVDSGYQGLFISSSAGEDLPNINVDSNNIISNGPSIYGDYGTNNIIKNNILIGNPGLQLTSGGGCRGPISIYNNIIVGRSSATAFDPAGCNVATAINNIIYSEAGSSVTSSFNGNYNLFYPAFSSGQSNSISGQDPNFVNPTGTIYDSSTFRLLRNYHYQSNSPVINAGTTLSLVTHDKDGTIRPQGSSYDIGAYESTAPTGPIGNPINACGTINSPGVYYLTRDLSSASNCLTISSSNVLVDGYNYSLNRRLRITLTGNTDCDNGGACTVEVSASNLNNISIKNLESNGAARATWIDNNFSIINSNFSAGVIVRGGDDFLVKDSWLGGLSIHGPTNTNGCTTFDPPYRFKVINNTIIGSGTHVLHITAIDGCVAVPSSQFFYTNGLVENNTVESTFYSTTLNYDTMIYLLAMPQNNTFRSNRFVSRSIYTIFMRDGADDNTFINNYFESDNSQRGALHFASGNEINSPSGNKFINNTFKGLNTASMTLQDAGENNYFEGNLFYAGDIGTFGNNLVKGQNATFIHNTFYILQSNGDVISLDSTTSSLVFRYNIIAAANSNNMYTCLVPSSIYSGDYNVFYGTGTLSYCGNNLANWRTTTGDDSGSVESNPLFVNAASGNFNLSSGSPACNIGGSYAGAYPCTGAGTTCTDSDSGSYPTINNLTQGTAVSGASSLTDSCSGNILTEYYCALSTSTSISSTSITCPFGCSNGACLPNAPDTTPPVISNIQNTSITTNSVNITWNTDEPSSTLVKHGISPGVYGWVVTGSNGITLHSIPLTGLTSGTTYYYVVNSSDSSGNTAQSPELMFTTLSLANASIAFVNPTPANNSVLTNPNVTINLSVTAPSGIDKVTIKINNNNYSLPNSLSCNFDNTLICDSGILATGTGTTYMSGIFGQGILVDTTDVLYAPNYMNTNEGTVIFWINPQLSWVNDANGYLLFDNVDDTQAPATGLLIWKPNNANVIRAMINTNTGIYSVSNSSSGFLNNVWHNIAFTYGAGNIEMYIDGILVNQSTYTGTITGFNQNNYIGVRRTNNYQSNAIYDEVNLYSTKLSSQEINNIYDKESGAYFVKLINLSNNIYNYNATLSRLGVNTNSLTQRFTVNSVLLDTQAPVISNIINPANDTYLKNRNYSFNATVIDDNTVSNVIFEYNFGGVMKNVTGVNLGSNRYSVTLRDIAAGSYNYKWYAYDSSNNLASTNQQLFTLNQAVPNCYLTFKPSQIVNWPMQTNVSVLCNPGNEIQPNMFRDDRNLIYKLVKNEIGINVSLTAGFYTYIANMNLSQNYTSTLVDDVNYMGIIAASNPIYLYLNSQQSNITITTIQPINVTVNALAGDTVLLRDGNDVTSEIGINILLPVGLYRYYAEVYTNSQSQENYTSYNISREYYVNVIQADITSPVFSNIINPTTSNYINNGNYPFNVTWTDANNLSSVWIEHNLTGSLRNTTVLLVGSQYSFLVTNLGAGAYSYRWYANDTSGNINRTGLISYTLNRAVSSCTLNGPISITYPNTVNMSGSCTNPESITNLYRNGINVNPENGINVSLNAGTYTYDINVTTSMNYSGASSNRGIIVNKASNLVTLTLNGNPGNVTIRENETLTAIGSSSSINFNMFRDNVEVTGTSGSPISLAKGLYQYKVNSTGNSNYLDNNTGIIYYVNVTDIFNDNQAPSYNNIINPSSNVYVKNKTYYFNITWNDASGISSVWVENNFSGSLINTSALSGGSYYYMQVSDLGVGSYRIKWYARDNSGNPLNVNNTNLITFNVTRATSNCIIQSLPSNNVIYPSMINVTASCNNPESSITLTRNGLNVIPYNGLNVSLKAGTYNYSINVGQSMNYSSAINSLNITVQKATNAVRLTINGQSTNFTTVLGTLLNAIPYSDSGTYTVYRNSVIINSTLLNQNLTLGNHTYFITSYGNENYTSNNTGYYLGVEVISCSINCPFAIDLNNQFNLISLPSIPTDNNIESVFAPVLSQISRVYAYDSLSNSWLVYNTNTAVPSSLSKVNPYQAYFVFTKNATGLTIYGNSTYVNGTLPSINLVSGWNLIGIHGTVPLQIQQFLLNQNITEIWKFNQTMNYELITDLTTYFEPGKGYWVYKQ